jgi:hypothetical protein
MATQTAPPAAVAASNSFIVQNPAALRAALAPLGCEVIAVPGAPGRVRLAFAGPWPSERHDETRGKPAPVDFPALIAGQLAVGEVVVLKEAGASSARYLAGAAIAFNAKGATVSVDLDEIYSLARALGPRVADDV